MSFNQSQQEAITHGNGPCLVLAGPGSGKTLTIVNRINYLMKEYKVRPEEILVITFTKYAADEMKHRFCKLVKDRSVPVTFGTFHAVYYSILKWAYRFNSENVFSENEKYQLISEIVNRQEIEIFDEEDFLKDIVTEIGIVKNNRYDIESYEPLHTSREIFYNIYTEYEQMRKRARKIDFDDMLVLCYNLFETRPDVLKMWQKRFQYILIDEFQDINQVQYDVITMLAAPRQNLFAVGDDDQSIYGFRGANARLMFRFEEDFPQAKRVLLNVNYRSTANIVKHALRVIGHNQVRFPKEILANKDSGQNIHVQEAGSPEEEQEYILEEIGKRLKEGVLPRQIAVLYRIHTDARALAEAMIKQGIPFLMKEQLPNIYQHFIGRDIQSYFKMALGSGKRQDFLQIMNRPKRYIGRDSLNKPEVSFEELRRFYCDKEWMQDRIDQFECDVKLLRKMAPYAAIQYLRKKIAYDEFLCEYAGTHQLKNDELFDVLAEIEAAARSFKTLEEWLTHVEGYTAFMKKQEQKQGRQQTEGQDGVRLMTMHAAKGLEFDTVFIIAANEGSIPYKKAIKNSLEEERRLFYVAMTRAKEVLKITYVVEKNGKELSPSRFIGELIEGIQVVKV